MVLDKNPLRTMLLLDMEFRPQSVDKELTSYGLPEPTQEELARLGKRISPAKILLLFGKRGIMMFQN